MYDGRTRTSQWMGILKMGIPVWMVAALLACAIIWNGPPPEASAADRAELIKEIEKLNTQSRAFTELFSKAIELAMPSVVSISTTRVEKVTVPQFGPEDFFSFPDPFRSRPQRDPRRQPRQREFKRSGLGSGFVVDAEHGYIVTNWHVVQGVKAEDITVNFSDGREVTALEVYGDSKTEVAVIKVEPDGLVASKWGTSDALRVGQWVIAIGSPLGYGNTVTTGIVSATTTKRRYFVGGKPRDLQLRGGYAIEDYIQTDAAINPGNSGGPLITLNGKVVGINTFIATSTGGSVGLGFAVPERIAQPVVEDLIKRGRVVRGHLGVSIINPNEVTDEAAWELFGMRNTDEVFNEFRIKQDDKGVLVAQVLENGPADKAEIKQGDLILAIGKKETPDVDTLRALIADTKPGTGIEITLMRKGRKRKVPVTVGEQPGDARIWAQAREPKALGLSVQTLTPEIAQARGYAERVKGVIVTDVEPGSRADEAGLEVDDVILDVNRKPVRTEEEFAEAIREISNEAIGLRVRRGDDVKNVVVKP